jgi:hypothetical protein
VASLLPQEVGESQWRTTQSWGRQWHGEGKIFSYDRTSRSCHESSSTGILGSSAMAAYLRLEPYPGRVQERCLRQNPRQALPPARRCRALGITLPLCWEGGGEGLSPLRGGKLVREGFFPSREKVAYQRRLGTCPTGQALRMRGERILPGSLCHPPGTRMGDARWKSSAADLQKTSLPRQGQ